MGIRTKKKGRLRKKFAIVATAGVLTFGGAVEAVSAFIPAPSGNPGGVIGNIDETVTLVENGAQVKIDITGYLPAKEVNLLRNDTTNRQLSAALAGLQSGISTALQHPDGNIRQQQDLQTVAHVLPVIKMIVHNKGIIPLSDVDNVRSIVSNRAQYVSAIKNLYNELVKGDPVMTAFAAAAASNTSALNAIQQLAPMVLSSKQEKLFQRIDIKKYVHDGQVDITTSLPVRDRKLFTSNVENKQLVIALSTLQSGIAAARANPAVTAQQQKDLATVAEFLPILNTVAKGKGMLPVSDVMQTKAALNDMQKYEAAIKNLYIGLVAGNPAMVSFAKTVAANPQALIAINHVAGKALPPEMQKFFKLLNLGKYGPASTASAAPAAAAPGV